jgi:hypothetical protein
LFDGGLESRGPSTTLPARNYHQDIAQELLMVGAGTSLEDPSDSVSVEVDQRFGSWTAQNIGDSLKRSARRAERIDKHEQRPYTRERLWHLLLEY